MDLTSLKQWLRNEPEKGAYIRRFECQGPLIHLLSSLAEYQEASFYWSDRNNRQEVAGFGYADVVAGEGDVSEVLLQIEKNIQSSSKIKYFGGMAFSPESKQGSEWHFLSAIQFMLPLVSVSVVAGRVLYAFHWLPTKFSKNEFLEKVIEVSTCFKAPSQKLYPLSVPFTHREDTPSKTEWMDLGQEIKAQLDIKPLKKIVLSRKSVFHFPETLCAYQMLHTLKNRDGRATQFCFKANSQEAFIGGTPERLFFLDDGVLHTEALAGTAPRGQTIAEDNDRARKLTQTPKFLREHKLVQTFIKSKLQTLCSEIDSPTKPSVFKLPLIQHLLIKMRGVLQPSKSMTDVIQALHPTPAVAGYPRKEALEWLKTHETYSRGWYSGPVGWVGHKKAEFVVAIRSGIISKNEVSLFSGAGFVSGSEPEDEWEEIEQKIGLFLKQFSPVKQFSSL